MARQRKRAQRDEISARPDAIRIEDAPGYATPASRRTAELMRAHVARGHELTTDAGVAIVVQVLGEMGVEESMRPMEMAFLSGMGFEHDELCATEKARTNLLASLAAFEQAAARSLGWSREHDEDAAALKPWVERVRTEVDRFAPPYAAAVLTRAEYVARFGRDFALAPDVAAALGTDEKTAQDARRRARAKLGERAPARVRSGRVRPTTGRAGKPQKTK